VNGSVLSVAGLTGIMVNGISDVAGVEVPPGVVKRLLGMVRVDWSVSRSGSGVDAGVLLGVTSALRDVSANIRI
jgi:hypothetical protein